MNDKLYCAAKTRSGGTCKHPPGWGTDHVGTGRCKLHGGATPRGIESPHFKSGKYSRYKDSLSDQLNLKVDQFMEGDPLNILHELAVLRALLSNHLEKADSMGTLPGFVDAVRGLADDIRKYVETIIKMRNQSAITAAEVAYIASRIPEVVMKYVSEPTIQDAIIDELFGVIPSNTDHSPKDQREYMELPSATVSTDE